MKYAINLQGCDDHTEVVMELTPNELAFVQRLAALTKATATYQCMPTMRVREADPTEKETQP